MEQMHLPRKKLKRKIKMVQQQLQKNKVNVKDQKQQEKTENHPLKHAVERSVKNLKNGAIQTMYYLILITNIIESSTRFN